MTNHYFHTMRSTLLCAALAGLMGMGCATTSPPPGSNTYTRLQDTVMLGTAIYLANKPDSRDELEHLYAALVSFSSGQPNLAMLYALFDRTLNGPLYAAALTFTLNELRRQGVDIHLPAIASLYIDAIRSGLGIALGMDLPAAFIRPQ